VVEEEVINAPCPPVQLSVQLSSCQAVLILPHPSPACA
jgi:hypothetical protein